MLVSWRPRCCHGERAPFPGWGTPVGFAVLSAVVEGSRRARYWGVVKRAGRAGRAWRPCSGARSGCSRNADPDPVLGNLIGMLGGSFLLAYFVELRRVARRSAIHREGRADGALPRDAAQVITTLGMIGFLAAGLWLAP